MDLRWSIEKNEYDAEKRPGTEVVFTLGNGFIGCRGFFEEETEGIEAQGGIYMAGVFGRSDYTPWKGAGRELVNTPNFLYCPIYIDGERVKVCENKISDFKICLEMKAPKYTREFTWVSKKGNRVKIKFERFISLNNIHSAGQKISITTVLGDPEILVRTDINADVTNLNLISSEPLPVQPGRKHLEVEYKSAEAIKVCINEPEKTWIAEGQRVAFLTPGSAKDVQMLETANEGITFKYFGIAGKTAVISKNIYIYMSKSKEEDPLLKVKDALAMEDSYDEEFEKHCRAWNKKWDVADIQIEGSQEDQRALRYNMLQLIQACPEHDEKLSIGARGLTGEMYEGCIFWDTEVFMLPFFTFTNQSAARKLLKFRYHTLHESRLHAKSNWFKGAMFGWQVSEKGIEQTPQGVGAYYSIHVIADIAYAILEYWYATNDTRFMFEEGIEILIETARFWESRVHKDPFSQKYNILAVRGPNEYDVIVNNNLYTNMMAQQNFILVIQMIDMMKKEYPQKWVELEKKLSFNNTEIAVWLEIIDNIVLPYNEELDLYEEDDMYLKRVPLNMKKAKPTAKRIIDTTIPYEGLMLYQITKQADTLHLMKNLPWRFTEAQIKNAWEFYVPKTCNDSSLSYSMHSVMAARLGLCEEAYRFFDISANLDIRDVQLNTISGLHFANFGGTWQAAVFGFAGVSVCESFLTINPHIPDNWDSMHFKIFYKESLLNIRITRDKLIVNVDKTGEMPIVINACNIKKELYKECAGIEVLL